MAILARFDRYLVRLIMIPLVASLVIAAMLLLLDKMLKLFDFVMNEGGPVSVVWRMLGNLIPEYLSLGIPIGVLLGILLGFRSLALSSELDALRAVGISYNRLLRVPFIFTIVLAGANLVNVFYLQPLSHYFYEELQYELRSGALGAAIKVGEFTTLKDKVALRIEQSADNGRKLTGIFARVANDKGVVLAISARQGQFLANRESPDTIILRLTDGQIVQDGPNLATPRVLTFSSHDLPIDLPKIEEFRQRGGKDKEYILPELLKLGWNKATPEALRNVTQASFSYRMVEVVMMLLLPLLAVALAIPPKRSTSALGVFLSIIMVVAYHKVNQYASDVASLGRVDPLIALWVPFALFAALIAWMYWRVAYVPGGQAIGGLERGFVKLSAGFRKLFGRKPLPDKPDQPEALEGQPLAV